MRILLKRAAQRAEARGMETTGCTPHGTLGDCGTCRLLETAATLRRMLGGEDLGEVRPFSLPASSRRGSMLMSASH